MTPSFSVHNPESQKTLKHCFIERKILDSDNLPAFITAKDGIVYQAIYDSKLPADSEFEAVISFQSHTYGNFAVIRLAKEESCSKR